MTFVVKYRGRDGSLREECVEAADRAKCVTECRSRGIAPVGIREGKAGKSGISGIAVAALVVAAVVGGAWWWMAREGKPETASVQQQGAKPKAEKPQVERPPRPSRRRLPRTRWWRPRARWRR